MTISVRGPDGSNLAFPDGTPEGDIVGAMEAHYGAAKPTEPAFDKIDPRFSGAGASGEKFLEGVPVLGGLVPKAGAAISAAAQPLTGVGKPGESFSERYAANLPQEEASSKAFEEANPHTSTALKVGGGIAGTLPLIAAAPAAFGVTGTLPQMVSRGALSGGVLSGADAAVRGEDVGMGTATGAILGAAAGPVGHVIGKAAGALMRPRGGGVPPVSRETMNVAGVDVPVPPSDVEAARTIEAARKGSSGTAAQSVVAESDAATQKALDDATAKVAENIAGAPGAAATSTDAAKAVQEHLQSAEQTRFQTEQARAERAALDAARLHADAAGVDPATGAPRPVVADSPFAAAETVGTGVQQAAGEARAARTAAYRDYAAVPGEYEPAAFSQVSNSLRQRLSGGASPVRITDELTPRAADSLRHLDDDVGTLRFQNDAQGRPVLDPQGQPVPRPITGQTIEEARKVLTQNYGDARRAAMAPGGSQADVRAMDRLIEAFDAHVADAGRAGAFSGDVGALNAAAERARASHAAYRRTFSRQGPGDEVGNAVEKIIGRYENQAATPDEIVKLSYGSASDPGGGKATRVAQRLRQIFGADSPEWGGYKQGLIRLLDDPALTPVQRADRIEKYLTSNNGRIHSQTVLSAEERAALADHAANLRRTEPVNLSELRGVDRVVAKISGRLDGVPSSTKEIVDYLYGGAKDAGDKSISSVLIKRLEREMPPEAFAKVRQGVLSHLMERPEGMAGWGPAQIANNLDNFLHSSLALKLYTAPQIADIRALSNAFRAQVPPAGATNPSGTAHMASRLIRSVSSMFLPAIGMATHGPAGALLGMAATPAMTGIKNARAASAARNLLYKPTSAGPVDPRFAAAGALLSRGLTQGQIENR